MALDILHLHWFMVILGHGERFWNGSRRHVVLLGAYWVDLVSDCIERNVPRS
jgi:hypothetical protein